MRTKRLTTSEAYALDIANLQRAGVFKAAPGTLCRCELGEGDLLFRVALWVSRRADGSLWLSILNRPDQQLIGPRTRLNATIKIEFTRCHFGGSRPWFRCQGLPREVHCGRRVRIVYLAFGAEFWACRRCWDLTYISCQKSDKRVNQVLKLSKDEYIRMLGSDDAKEILLAVKAGLLSAKRADRQLQRKISRRKVLKANSAPQVTQPGPAEEITVPLSS
jgi:hypothetical protein